MVYLIGSSEIDLYLRCPQIRRWTVRNAKVTPLGATWERTQALRGLRLGDLVELEVHHQQLCEQVLRLTRSFFACRTVGERIVRSDYYLLPSAQSKLNQTKESVLLVGAASGYPADVACGLHSTERQHGRTHSIENE
jgi:hypothetical protein